MEITGTWISGNNLKLTITGCSENIISGKISILVDFNRITREFKGILLGNNKHETIFCFFVPETKGDHDHLLIKGIINKNKYKTDLTIVKYSNQKDSNEVNVLYESFIKDTK